MRAEGMAALGICELLLLALTDLKIITEEDARDLLADVVTTHNDAATASLTPERNSGGSGNRGAHPRWQERYALALTQINAPHCFRASASVNEAHMNDSKIEMRLLLKEVVDHLQADTKPDKRKAVAKLERMASLASTLVLILRAQR